MNISGNPEETKQQGGGGSEPIPEAKREELLRKTENHTESVRSLNVVASAHLKEEEDDLDAALELNSIVPDSQRGVVLPAEEQRPYKCSQCARCFARSDDCEKHQQSHKWEKQSFQQIVPSKKYRCLHCLKNFATLSHFIVHQQIHRGEGGAERPFSCSQCGKRFYRESGLKAHEQSHSGEMAHRCAQCDKLFPKKSILTRHQQTHISEGPFCCSGCPQKFSTKRSHEKHVGQSHGGQRKSFSHCRSFSGEHGVKKHKHAVSGKKLHTTVKPVKRKSYWCSHCGKIFASLSHFFVHQQIHRGNGKGGRPFSCTQCGKSFYKEKGLKTHEQRHIGEGVHCCSSGGESSKALLMRNQQTHARRKPARCFKCDRSNFLEIRTSTCHYCTKTFSADFTQQEHLRAHRETMLDRANVQNQSSMGDACSVVPGSVRKTNKGLVMDLKTGRCDFDFKKSVEFHSYLRSAECHHKERQDDTGESSLKDNTGPPDEKPSIALQMFTGHLADREETPMMQNTENLAEISGKATKPEKVSLRKESPLNLGADEFLSGDSCRLKVIMMEEVKEEKEDQKDSAIRESVGTNDCAADGTEAGGTLRHQQIHGVKGSLQPSGCGKKLRQDGWGVQRQMLVTGEQRPKEAADGRKTYCCLECGRRFNSMTHYIVHLQIHRKDGKEERPFSCSCCGKSFYRVQGLKKHQQSDVCQGSACCSQCGKSLKKSLLSDGHRSLAAEGAQRCSKCEQGRDANVLKGRGVKSQKQPEARGNGDNVADRKSYSCSHCGKVFRELIDHIVHQQIHREGVRERSFSCSLCGKSFYREGGLRKHQQTHGAQTHPTSAKHHTPLRRAKSPGEGGRPSDSRRGETIKPDLVLLEQVEHPDQLVASEGGGERGISRLQRTDESQTAREGECGTSASSRKTPSDCKLEGGVLTKQLKWKTKLSKKLEHSKNGVFTGSDVGGLKIVKIEDLKAEETVDDEVILGGQGGSYLQAERFPPSRLDSQGAAERCQGLQSRGVSSKAQKTHGGVQPGERACVEQPPAAQKTYCCVQCGKRFLSTTDYLVHLQIHRGTRPFSCSRCGKSYYRAEGLRSHQQTEH